MRAWPPLPHPSCHSRASGKQVCRPLSALSADLSQLTCPSVPVSCPVFSQPPRPVGISEKQRKIHGSQNEEPINGPAGLAAVTRVAVAHTGCVRPHEQPRWAASRQHLGSPGCTCLLTQHFCSWMHTLEKLHPMQPRRNQVDFCEACHGGREHTAWPAQPGTALSIVRLMTHFMSVAPGEMEALGMGSGTEDGRKDCDSLLMAHLYI